MNYALSYPALNGDTVTQGHANYCETDGHAVHKVDGIVSPICPRCGSAQDMEFASRTYAEYLATMTVKTLRSIARQAGITGYSKFLKAELVFVIDIAITSAHSQAIELAAQIEAQPTMDKVRTLMQRAIKATESVAQSAYNVWITTDDESAYQLYLDADLMARTTQRAFHHGYPGVM